VGGLLLLLGFAAPLGLVLLAPITVQIFLFHLVPTPGVENIVLPLLMVATNIVAALRYSEAFVPLFKKG
jgi:hypothetical protein